jgi:hypothetical protein
MNVNHCVAYYSENRFIGHRECARCQASAGYRLWLGRSAAPPGRRSDAGGERAAIAYSILGSCRLAGVDPREYLADVLPRLTGRIRLVDLPSLLPARWAAQRAASAGAADTANTAVATGTAAALT